MKRLFFIGIIGFCLMMSVPCVAQGKGGTLSGTVLDTKGKPIAGFVIGLSSRLQGVKTNEKGAFTFTNIPAGPIQITIPVQTQEESKKKIPNTRPIVLLAPSEPDYEIVSIKIGNITLFQHGPTHFGGISFGVKPGGHFENVAVTVQLRARIRARVVFKDGKPLTNARITEVITHEDVDGTGSGRSSGGSATNSEGYFVHYIQKDDVPAHYTILVKYRGLSAQSEKILIEDGTRHDDLVLTLDGVAPPPKPTSDGVASTPKPKPSSEGAASTPKPKPDTTSRESLPSLLRKLTKTLKPSDEPDDSTPPPLPVLPARPGRFSSPKNVWVVNPANGHAYRKIRCRNLKDAQKQAATEGAYLVAINDEAEQKWLSGIFGNSLYWIGLSDAETEGDWVWQSGEPLTYTNWGPKQRFPRSTLSDERKDSAVMTFINGMWHAVGPGDLFWRVTKQALLEKGTPLTEE